MQDMGGQLGTRRANESSQPVSGHCSTMPLLGKRMLGQAYMSEVYRVLKPGGACASRVGKGCTVKTVVWGHPLGG